MYEALTAEELLEWEAAYAVDPWGPEREELLHGVLCSLVDACHRAKGQPQPPLHYMPYAEALRGKKPQQSEEQMKEQWKIAVAAWGKKK